MGTPIRRTTRGEVTAAPDLPASGGGGQGRDLEAAITVLRARIDEEFRITERLDSKSRQAFALAAGYFAVVQTVAFGAFAATGVTRTERVFVAFAGLVAGVLLLVVAHRLGNGEETLEEIDIDPGRIVTWANDAGEDPEHLPARLVGRLAKVAARRAENNAIRERDYGAVANASRLALICASVELVVGIIVRI